MGSYYAGTVIRCRTDLMDLPPGLREPQHPRGNEICIKRADEYIVVLAHPKQGSVRVREGEAVEPGMVIAAVGNSDNSSEPHLHLHVADAADQDVDGVLT